MNSVNTETRIEFCIDIIFSSGNAKRLGLELPAVAELWLAATDFSDPDKTFDDMQHRRVERGYLVS